MNLITTIGNGGLVLDTDGSSRKSGREAHRRPWSPGESAEFTGHFILNRYRVDDDGHICLTPALPLHELHGSTEVFKAELESLLEQAKQRFPESIRTL